MAAAARHPSARTKRSFPAFSLETGRLLIERGEVTAAGIYVIASLALSIAAMFGALFVFRHQGCTEQSANVQVCGLPFLHQKKVKAVRAVLLALTLFLACDAQALDLRCATLSPQQLVACLQQCPDTQRGVACRKSCIHEHDKVKSACKRPPFIAPGRSPMDRPHPHPFIPAITAITLGFSQEHEP